MSADKDNVLLELAVQDSISAERYLRKIAMFGYRYGSSAFLDSLKPTTVALEMDVAEVERRFTSAGIGFSGITAKQLYDVQVNGRSTGFSVDHERGVVTLDSLSAFEGGQLSISYPFSGKKTFSKKGRPQRAPKHWESLNRKSKTGRW